MNLFLSIMSVIGIYCLLFGLFFLVQRFTIGLLPFFEKRIWKFSLGDLVFVAVSLLIIWLFVEVN